MANSRFIDLHSDDNARFIRSKEVTGVIPTDQQILQYDGVQYGPISSGGTSGVGDVISSYGQLFEHKDATSLITVATAGQYYGWVTSEAGLTSGAGTITTDTSNATADQLIVGENGAGTYSASFSISCNGSSNSLIEGAIHVNDVKHNQLSAFRKLGGGDFGNVGATGLLTLNNSCYVDLRVTSDGDGNVIRVGHVQLTLHRVGPE